MVPALISRPVLGALPTLHRLPGPSFTPLQPRLRAGRSPPSCSCPGVLVGRSLHGTFFLLMWRPGLPFSQDLARVSTTAPQKAAAVLSAPTTA